MRYANDNAVVKAIYDFTHGSLRPLFIGIVVTLALVSLYFPVRDLYVAKRSNDILAKQVEIREQYRDEMKKDTDKWLSEEGIKDRARELGMVMPGEKRIEVQGLEWPRRLRKSARTRRGTFRRLTCCLVLAASKARRSRPAASSAQRGARNDKLQTL